MFYTVIKCVIGEDNILNLFTVNYCFPVRTDPHLMNNKSHQSFQIIKVDYMVSKSLSSSFLLEDLSRIHSKISSDQLS